MTLDDHDHDDDTTAPLSDPPPPRRSFLRRHWLAVTAATLIALPAAAFFIWATSTLAFAYSSGHRVGFNQKLSRRGWICKTWEGELAISSVPGVAPEIFRYSVRDDSVAAAIRALEGDRVAIAYDEHRGVPTSCFGDTRYFATGVRRVP